MNAASRHVELNPDALDRQAGGGATTEPVRRHQPKAALCRMLSILWSFPSAGAVLILATTEAGWRRTDGWLAGLGAVRLEQWIALALLLAHPVLIWLAWRLKRTEAWKEIASEQDPDLQDSA